MNTAIAGFDWDSGNWPKCGKHGVTKEEIEDFFLASPFIMPDPNPAEPRMRAIGKTKAGRHIFLVFMLRTFSGRTYIRPISARYMHKKEVDHHEKANAKNTALITK